MPFPPIEPQFKAQDPSPTKTHWFRWWPKPSLHRQEVVFAFTPLMALLIFMVFVFLSYSYIQKEQQEGSLIGIQQSVNTISQQMSQLLADNEDSLQNIAINTMQSANHEEALQQQTEGFLRNHPEITAVYWNDTKENKIYVQSNTGAYLIPDEVRNKQILDNQLTPPTTEGLGYGKLFFSYSRPYPITPEIALMYANARLPSIENPTYILSATYDLDRLIRQLVPKNVSYYTKVWFVSADNQILASTHPNQSKIAEKSPVVSIEIPHFDKRLSLRAQSTHDLKSITASFLFWFTVCLCLFISALLILNWWHIRSLIFAQDAAERESNFRRAVEDSITTGLQAFDMNGNIIYVNPAFCEMTGYQADDLLGCAPPYPYWPEDLHQELLASLQRLIASKPHHAGRELQLQRHNGEFFYVKLYISPLMNSAKEQSGWITAITDISESKRSREELALAGQRFTTVLEGMDAAISVAAIGTASLLFTNNTYRKLFNNSEAGHALLLSKIKNINPTEALTQIAEANGSGSGSGSGKGEGEGEGEKISKTEKPESQAVYLEEQDRWVEVRSQYLAWVDGRVAQMLITTDITEQHKAEARAAIQAEQAEAANRLITMGEMASSLAHELNQPLTAINNYCSGLIKRIQDGKITHDELLLALEKTAKQANRAGVITHRIRSFVKKKEPNQILASVEGVMDNIYDFIEIDSKRRNIEFKIHIEENIPLIMMDPTLIEQVMLNLTRNAVESIYTANRPIGHRYLQIDVKRQPNTNGNKMIEFSVLDSGAGMPDEVIEHMFDAFYTTKPNGLGIGLNLCRSIIESHGGRFYFKNIYKNDMLTGCLFSFTLPYDKA